MSVFVDPTGSPVEIAPGRGDLRYSAYPLNIRRDAGGGRLVGGRTLSYGNLFASQPWVASAIMRMLTWAVRVPLKVYRREGDSRVQLQPDEHPLARMVKRPWMGAKSGNASSQARLVQTILGPLMVHGNTLHEIEVIGGEEWLNPLDWRKVIPIGLAADDMNLRGWRYMETSGNWRDIPLNKTLHYSYWSPLGPLGISPLEQLGTTISVEDAAQRYQAGLFANGARPPSAITTSENFIQMERRDRQVLLDQLRQDVDELYSGPDRAGKPAVLPPGLDWKQIGHTAVEAELIKQRLVAREEVCGVYLIPPPMLGILDNATYSNINTQREMAYTDCLGPPLVLIEQTLTAILARDYYGEDDVYLEFDFGPVLRGDRLKEINAYRLGIMSGIYTPNESRRGLNLEASDQPGADELWMPQNNMAPMGKAPVRETLTGPAQPDQGSATGNEPTPSGTPEDSPSEGARRLAGVGLDDKGGD